MRGLNKVTLIGNLGKDPEYQRMENGSTLAKFTLATNESYKDKDGNIQTITDWHNIVAWRSLADLVNKYTHKGSQIYVEGKLKTRSYEDKDKTTKYVTEIVADSILLLDKPENK